MRRIRYSVAMSLDGYIAGPKGEADWIIMDNDIDFEEWYDQFDTILVGRRTFDTFRGAGTGHTPGMQTIVFSRTLRQADYPKITIVADPSDDAVTSLRSKPGKDIWLFGGAVLFRSLADAGLVDTVEVGVIPVLLGGGIPLLPPPGAQVKLQLTGHKVYKKTGTVSLEYAVQPATSTRRTPPKRSPSQPPSRPSRGRR